MYGQLKLCARIHKTTKEHNWEKTYNHFLKERNANIWNTLSKTGIISIPVRVYRIYADLRSVAFPFIAVSALDDSEPPFYRGELV